MKTTTKKHWVNGHQIRGGWFHTYTASFGRYGVMLSWGKLPNGYRVDRLKIDFYKLI